MTAEDSSEVRLRTSPPVGIFSSLRFLLWKFELFHRLELEFSSIVRVCQYLKMEPLTQVTNRQNVQRRSLLIVINMFAPWPS